MKNRFITFTIIIFFSLVSYSLPTQYLKNISNLENKKKYGLVAKSLERRIPYEISIYKKNQTKKLKTQNLSLIKILIMKLYNSLVRSGDKKNLSKFILIFSEVLKIQNIEENLILIQELSEYHQNPELLSKRSWSKVILIRIDNLLKNEFKSIWSKVKLSFYPSALMKNLLYIKDAKIYLEKLELEDSKISSLDRLAMLCQAYNKLGRYDKAIKICSKKISNVNDHLNYFRLKFTLFTSYIYIGDIKKARSIVVELSQKNKKMYKQFYPSFLIQFNLISELTGKMNKKTLKVNPYDTKLVKLNQGHRNWLNEYYARHLMVYGLYKDAHRAMNAIVSKDRNVTVSTYLNRQLVLAATLLKLGKVADAKVIALELKSYNIESGLIKLNLDIIWGKIFSKKTFALEKLVKIIGKNNLDYLYLRSL